MSVVNIKKRTHERQLKAWADDIAHEPYLRGIEKSEFAAPLIAELAGGLDSSILELGCNVGRNLEYLRVAGYTNLAGIEISPRARALREEHYPELEIEYYEGSIEERILDCGTFDVVFSMAVLQHIHPDSDWIFAEIARVAQRGIVTIEDEVRDTKSLWPRNYGTIFTSLGYTEIRAANCKRVKGLRRKHYVARQFVKSGP